MGRQATDMVVTAGFSVQGLDEALHPVRFRMHEQISGLFRLDLLVAARSNAIPFSSVVDRPGLLTLSGTEGERLLHGVVGHFKQGDSGQRYTLYEVGLVPLVWRLLHRRDCRIFQKSSIKTIIDDVLDPFRIPHELRSRGNRDPSPREYCVQYRESDWAFISRLLEEEGYYYWFEHGDDRHTLRMANDSGMQPGIPGDRVLPFRAQDSTAAAGAHIFSFHYGESVRSGMATHTDFNFLRPSLDLLSGRAGGRFTDLESYDYPGGFATPEEGRALAQVRLDEEVGLTRLGEGASCCARLVPGHVFALTGHGRADLNDRQYLVTRVEHIGEKREFDPDVGDLNQALTYSNRFACVPRELSYRPPRVTRRPVVQGVQTAVVVGPDNEEIHTDKLGRVKVRFHWDRLSAGDQHSSCWIRVSQLVAGQAWGALWLPRVGQEVIVDFLEGDPDRPIITGRVYHGQNPPPLDLPAEKTRSTIKSSSTPGGKGYNELAFEDRAGQEEIVLHAQRDLNETVKHDMSTSVGSDQSVSVGGDRTVSVSGNESVSVNGNESVSVGGSESVTVSGSRSLSVGGNETIRVSGGRTEDITGAEQMTVIADRTHKVRKSDTVTVIQTREVRSLKTMTFESLEKMVLKVGGSTITISPSGIKIKGPRVKINHG